MVLLKYYGAVRDLIGISSEAADVNSIADALGFIEKKYGKPAKKEAHRMLIAVNGTGIQLLRGEKTALAEGDVVSFLPLGAGG